MTLMELTNRVKELRAKHRYTQNDLAERVNVTRQTIVALEKGSYIPSLLLAMKIARTFELPIEEIFFMEEEKIIMNQKFLFSIGSIFFFGWAMIAFYYAQMDFAQIIKNPEPPWSVTMNMTPVFAALLFGGIMTAILIKKSKKKNKSFAKLFFLPPEFEESDEREQEITAKACRASYVTMWYTFPVLTALMLIYPLISETIPYYPVIIIMLLPLVQSIAYFLSWKKHY